MTYTEAYTPNDRRPIATREKGWSKNIATRLAAGGWSPNGISIAGMLSAIVAGLCLLGTSYASSNLERLLWILAALGMQGRLLANMFDGMVAVATGRASPVGELYNEVPDRISDIAILVGLGYASDGNIILGYVAAIAAVLTAYVRAMVKVAGAPQDYCGPMAKPQRMFITTVTAIYMAVTPDAWHAFAIDNVVNRVTVPTLALIVIAVGSFITAWRRLIRGARRLQSQSSVEGK